MEVVAAPTLVLQMDRAMAIVLPSLCAMMIPSALGFATPPRSHRNIVFDRPMTMTANGRRAPSPSSSTTRLYNIYDDWSRDLLSSSQSEHTYDELVLPLEEESIERCLEEFAESEYGGTMFGRHDLPASVGITGEIEFDSLEGPEAILSLTGKFWHRRGEKD